MPWAFAPLGYAQGLACPRQCGLPPKMSPPIVSAPRAWTLCSAARLALLHRTPSTIRPEGPACPTALAAREIQNSPDGGVGEGDTAWLGLKNRACFASATVVRYVTKDYPAGCTGYFANSVNSLQSLNILR